VFSGGEKDKCVMLLKIQLSLSSRFNLIMAAGLMIILPLNYSLLQRPPGFPLQPSSLFQVPSIKFQIVGFLLVIDQLLEV
jgi:hypothetical protein